MSTIKDPIMLDSTGQTIAAAILALGENSDQKFDASYASRVTKSNIDDLFVEWWHCVDNGLLSRTELLSRWFNLLRSEKTFGVKTYEFNISVTADGELTDDSIELGVCVPSTNTVKGTDNFCKEVAFWTVEVEYEIDELGEIVIMRVDHIDDDYTRAGTHGMVGVAQKKAFVREYKDGTYKYLKYSTKQQYGFKPLPECVKPDGTLRAFMVHAKYGASLNSNGIPTSATGGAPMNFDYSHNSEIAAWRKRGTKYSGGSACDLKFREYMFRLKYAKKGNSGVMEGCTNYNLQYPVALGEENTNRVLLTPTQASGFLIGSSVQIGNYAGNMDRNHSGMYSITKNAKIVAIKNVTIGDVEYGALYIEGLTFTTVANGSGVTGTTYVSTTPYAAGFCDNVLGVDGSAYSNTSGKEPFIIQGIECQMGAYAIAADMIVKRYYDSATDKTYYQFWTCKDAAKISTSITSDYVLEAQIDISDLTSNNWYYIQDLAIANVIAPEAVGGSAGSGNGCKAATYLTVGKSDALFEYLAWAHLYDGALCGLACSILDHGLSAAYWDFAALACGSGANRGEFTA